MAANQKYLTSSDLKTINGNSIVGEGNLGIDSLVETTWSALKQLRDSSGLTPGVQYRITDYNTTTTQGNTQAAGHQFDVIVVADATNKLNENARACLHQNDTYFANCRLEAWELKYCLDNDTNKYAWADATNGKGVIYWMKDEFGNECPYDFKNIQFKRYKITSSVVGTLVGKYATSDANNVTVDTSTPYWCYTFSTDSLEDSSLNGYSNDIYNNIISEYVESSLKLNNIVFIGSYSYGNRFSVNCYNNTFGCNCTSNTFGSNCLRNTFGDNCTFNTFGSNCSMNTFGDNYTFNTFGDNCLRNTFGNYCTSNTFGVNCTSNTFGDNYTSNTFGSNCLRNTFGNYCMYNTFGNYCTSNTFGDNCSNNTFGNYCVYITFGNGCSNNTFGNYCISNTFGNNIEESQFGNGVQYFSITTSEMTTQPSTSDTKSYIRWLIVENGVQNVNVYCTGTTSYSNRCQNIKIKLGVKGASSSNRLQIDVTSQIGATDCVTYQTANSHVINI